MREKVDDGGAEAECAHFFAFAQDDRTVARFGINPLAHGGGARRIDDARPYRADAGGYGGTDQNLHHAAEFGIKEADEAFVAGKQVGDVFGEEGIDGKQFARHINHAAQSAVAGHVDAVVVARGKVGGEEKAV